MLKPDARELSPSLLDLNPPESSNGETPKGFAEARDRMASAWERQYLQMLMKRTEGNLSRASRESGIERTYLRRLLKKYRIDRAIKDDPN